MTLGTADSGLPAITFVLGMHRSGSSALARVLNLAGLRISGQLMAANQDNPSGYWEPQRVVRFNDDLLKHLGRHWADPKPLPPDWVAQCEATPLSSRIVALMHEEAAQASGQGSRMIIKDPRLSRLMPLWKAVLSSQGMEATCLITCRSPIDVHRSLHARDRVTRDHALELWLAYMLDAEASTRGWARRVVHYDQLMSDWRHTLEGVVPLIGGPDAIDLDRRGPAIEAFLDAGLRHHSAKPHEFPAGDGLLQILHEAHALFLAADGLQRVQEFDELGRRLAQSWARRSPGPAGSGVERQMPGWHAEQSWDAMAQGDFVGALKSLDSAILMAPDVPRFHHLRGNALGRLGRRDAAEAAHRRAVALDPTVPRFHRAWCDALGAAGQFVEAADALDAHARRWPAAVPPFQHGQWLARAERFEDAVAAYRRALTADGSPAPVHRALSHALTYLGRTDEALDALSSAMARDPAAADLHDTTADLQAGAGRWQQARAAYDRALSLRRGALGLDPGRPGDEPLPPKGPGPKADLLGLAARLGARHWAADLCRQLRLYPPSEVDSAHAWPLGPLVQRRPLVPVVEPDIDRDAARPLLSVMIPVYGVAREAWLHRCLDSVLAQDRDPPSAEIVVVDDASDDRVAQSICRDRGGRVRYLRNDRNLGLVGNHNRCISMARGQFVHILHQDDFVEPGFYDALLGPMLSDERLVAGFTHSRFVDADGNLLSKVDPPRPQRGPLQDWPIRLSLELRIQFPSIIVRRSAYLHAGGFLPSRRFSFDWDLWNRVAASGPVWFEPRPLAYYRMHESSATYTFSPKDRVVDAMQTVAAMIQLLPGDQQAATAEMGMYKFFRRYWGLATQAPFAETDPERSALVDFLLSGWTDETEQRRLRSLIAALA